MSGESVYIKEHKQIIEGVIHRGTATGGAAGTLIDTDIPATYLDGTWKDERLFIFAGTGKGQTRKISGYTKTTRTFTIYDNWITNPDTTSRYQVIIGTGTVGAAAAGDATAANQAIIIADIGTVDGKVDAVNTDLGDFSGQANLQSLLAALGVPDVAAKPLYTCLVTDRLDHGTHGLSAIQTDVAAVNTDLGDFSGQANLQSLLAALGVPDVAAKPLYTCLVTDRLDHATHGLSALQTDVAAVNTDLGDFSGQANLQSLLAALGVPDVAAKPLYTCLVTDRLDNALYGLSSIRDHQAEVSDVVIYPVAEHAGTTVIADDGTSPAFYADTESGNATVVGTPNVHWIEDIDFEQEGSINVISIFAELRWEHKTAGGTAYSKVQMSRDGGSNWVDMTDAIAETNVAYQNKTRIGVGKFVNTIVAGVDQLKFRLISWEAGGNSSSAKMRSDSYIRITYRKLV